MPTTIKGVRALDTRGFMEALRQDTGPARSSTLMFFLGSGASVPSGIPSAGPLVDGWLSELHRQADTDLSREEWLATANPIAGFEPSNPAASYARVFEALYPDAQAQNGFAHLEQLMAGREPSIGYSTLAWILSKTPHKAVVTTNFDNLVADALTIYTETTPLICGHESLAPFIRPNLQRPLIAKIHRDLMYAPFNESKNTGKLAKGWKDALKNLFLQHIPIFIGYGGNDPGVMKFLKNLSGQRKSMPLGMYWCILSGDDVRDDIAHVVKKQLGAFVLIDGFEELMRELKRFFNAPTMDEELDRLTQRRIQRYHEVLLRIYSALPNGMPPPKAEDPESPRRIGKVTAEGTDWVYWALRVRQARSLKEANAAIARGLQLFPESVEYLGSCATYLHALGREEELARAKELYERAYGSEKCNPNTVISYATFLYEEEFDFNRAEELFKDVLHKYPSLSIAHSNYAVFLEEVYGNYELAEKHYRACVDADPYNATHLGNLACLLMQPLKKYADAEELYKRAIEIDPNNANNLANYANLLKRKGSDYSKAEELYKKCIDLDPTFPEALAAYAIFLRDVRRDNSSAEALFQRAIVAAEEANYLRPYAESLYYHYEEFDMAEDIFKRLLEAQPGHVGCLASYAYFLLKIRKDDSRARAMFSRALEIRPELEQHPRYIEFLRAQGREGDAKRVEAEGEQYK
jgi:tetratricopeptide (TPR) repeat protein